jgi:hypothetical protein
MFATEWRRESYLKYGDKKISASDFRINAYPIRTYVDFELDKDPKEEFKVEPLAQVLEFMGSILPNEQIWMQIVLRKCGKKGGVLNTHDEDEKWLAMVKKEVEKIRELATLVPGMESPADIPDSERYRPKFPHPTESQKMQMQSMERNLGKYPFEVGMRGTYITTNGNLRGPVYTGNRWIWRPFGNPQFQTHLRPRRWHCDFDYPWQDFHDIRWVNQARRFLDAYRRRSFFHSPWIIPTNILTNEELASIWHPPSRTVMTPGLARIPATKAEPPANLPR